MYIMNDVCPKIKTVCYHCAIYEKNKEIVELCYASSIKKKKPEALYSCEQVKELDECPIGKDKK